MADVVYSPSPDRARRPHVGQDEQPILEPKHSIFLSHSGINKPFVEQLYLGLEREHHFAFFDRRDHSLPLGEEFKMLIKQAATQCYCAVIVLSEEFLTSKWPMLELFMFLTAMKQRIPIGGNKSAPTRMPADNSSFKPYPDFNPFLKLLPLFYKIKPDQLKNSVYRNELWNKLINNFKGIPFSREDYDKALDKLESDIYGKFLLGPGEKPTIQYLGLFGRPGIGKPSVCCEAMCNYMREIKGFPKLCRVKLDYDKVAEGNATEKKRMARLKNAIKQLVGLSDYMSSIMDVKEGQNFLVRQLRHIQLPVFLVVDNASESNLLEAKFYAIDAAKLLPGGSFVVVTSRSSETLKRILFGDDKYCKRFPALNDHEAGRLFLSTGEPKQNELESCDEQEHEILDACLRKCRIDNQYVARNLAVFASYLWGKGGILQWKRYIETGGDILGLEYNELDDVSKLIFLDLAIFYSDLYLTHLDFHADVDWGEHDRLKLAIESIAMLHGIPFIQAEEKVKKMRGSFLKQSSTDVSVSHDYSQLALSVLTKGVKEKNWCVLCTDDFEMVVGEEFEDVEYFYELLDEDSSTLLRVGLVALKYDPDLYRIPTWSSVKLLDLTLVEGLPSLDLHGLRSLRILKVLSCIDIEKIECSCKSLFKDGRYCYEKRRGCLSELRVVQLNGLPKLKEASFAMHCRRLETLWFYECPNLGCLPDLRFCRKLKRLRLPCGDYKGFQGLKNNQTLTELAFHWDPKTVRNLTEDVRMGLLVDVMRLTNLTVLDIVDEKILFDWIPSRIRFQVGGLKNLTFLDLSCASTIKKVEGLEELSQLTSLGLYGCCKLRSLPSPTVLRHLKRLCIAHCHELATGAEYKALGLQPFHALGESCCFGAHQCLDGGYAGPEDYSGIPYFSEDEYAGYFGPVGHIGKAQSRHPSVYNGLFCRKCDPKTWEAYMPKDEDVEDGAPAQEEDVAPAQEEDGAPAQEEDVAPAQEEDVGPAQEEHGGRRRDMFRKILTWYEEGEDGGHRKNIISKIQTWSG